MTQEQLDVIAAAGTWRQLELDVIAAAEAWEVTVDSGNYQAQNEALATLLSKLRALREAEGDSDG